MNDSGTNSENNSQITPTTEDEYLNMLNLAVSEGDNDKVSQLMAMDLKFDTSPDAEDDQDQNVDPADKAGEAVGSDGNTVDVDGKITEVPQAGAADLDAANTRVNEQPQNDDANKDDQIVKLTEQLHRLQSAAGRVDSLQSRLHQLESELRNNRAATKATEAVIPKNPDVDNKIKEQLQALREVDPGTAELLEAMQARFDEQLTAAQQAPIRYADELNQQAQQARLQQEYEKVLSQHPDFGDIARHVSWATWKSTLNAQQREWAESDDSAKVAVAVTEFKRAHGLLREVNPPVQQQAAPVVNEPVVQDQAALARQRRLESTATGRETSIKATQVFDPEAAFKEEYNKTLKSLGIEVN